MTIHETDLYTVIGKKIKAYRTELKITQSQLAEEVEVTRTSITNIEKGMQKPPLHLLYRLCNALGVKITDVIPPASEVRTEQEIKLEDDPMLQTFVERAMDDLESKQNGQIGKTKSN